MNGYNFNEHIVKELLNEYGGSDKKKTVILDDGNKYMLKLPDPTREVKRELAYINNAISEYLGCRIFNICGFDVQDTILGLYIDEKGHEKIACACKDIQQVDKKLLEMEKIELSNIYEDDKLTLDSVYALIQRIDNLDNVQTFIEYCNRFIIDALIGNTDRHNGNWGLLTNNDSTVISPVYDCASSLSPLYEDKELTDTLISQEANNTKSAIVDEQGIRLYYRDFILSCNDSRINDALKRVVPRIKIDEISCLINNTPYISDVRKHYYNSIINIRYEQILIPALEKSLGIEKSTEYKQWNSKLISYLYNKYIVPLNNNDFSTLNNYHIKTVKNKSFILDENDYCVGIVRLEKSNLNVCKFVQVARKLGFDIDSDINFFIDKSKKEKNGLGNT